MPVISRILSIALRIGEVAFGAVVAGVIGSYLHEFKHSDNKPQSRWIYTEVVAGLSILLGVVWLIPFSSGFFTWPLDVILSLAWFASFGLLVHTLHGTACDSIWDWGEVTDGGFCARWKTAEAFTFLSAIFWLVSALVGLWFTYRVRDRRVRPIAGDGGYRARRSWYGRRHVV